MDTETTKKIDGVSLANDVLEDLQKRIAVLKKKNIVPKLAVIHVGDDAVSRSYINQKRKTAKKIGARFIVKSYTNAVFFQELAEAIHMFNADPSVHGIIIQRPLPPTLSTSSFNTAVALEKDIDGFRPKSIFNASIALAVFDVLRYIFQMNTVTSHLKNQQIAIIGRGETAGKPIAELFSEKKIPFIQCHSKTTNIKEFTQEADIIISCVGKPGVITPEMIKDNAILIGIGIGRDEKGKLHGDYIEQDIREKALYYTPTPGGTGPLNVAYLLSNLVKAAENTLNED